MAFYTTTRCALLLLLLAGASADSSERTDSGCADEELSATSFLQQHYGTQRSVKPGTLGGAAPLPVGYITTVAGNLGVEGTTVDDHPARGESLGLPGGVRFHPITEDLWISEQGNNALRVVDHNTGILRTVAGAIGRCTAELNTPNDFCAEPNDGADARDCNFKSLHGIEWDLETNGIYIADMSNNAIRYIDPETNIITSAVGHAPAAGYSGDGGLASDSLLNKPHCVVMHQRTKDLYVADGQNSAVRKVDGKTGVISTLWKNADATPVDLDLVERPDGGLDLYMTESGLNTLRRIDAVTGQSTIIAGKPQKAMVHSGDGGPAIEAEICYPAGVRYDPETGDIYISEWKGHTVRRIDGKSGIITTIAGKAGVAGSTGDDGPAEDALLSGPGELDFVPKYRWLFVTDVSNFAFRLIQL